MSSELINLLSEELITAATRQDLEGTLKFALAGQEQAGTRREHLMARQVLRAQLVMRVYCLVWLSLVA
nr:virulence factor SrfC family protein [Candidatus Symbiopectobacterium sp. PLON1]